MHSIIISSVQLLSHVWLFVTSWTAACQASLSITNSESTQTHVHWVGDAIKPSHHLLSPSPLALNLSQHQSLFKWVSSSHQVAKVLEFQLQLNFDNSIIITIHLWRRETIYCSSDGKEFPCQCRSCRRRRFRSQEDPLEKEMATHSSILVRIIPWKLQYFTWCEEPTHWKRF